jgi:ZIP family zinc transporter
MINSFQDLHPINQALLATCFTWAITALGAATVFMTMQVNIKLLDGMLGFAAGVMIAASYWSLLAPAIEMSENTAVPAWFPAPVGRAASKMVNTAGQT